MQAEQEHNLCPFGSHSGTCHILNFNLQSVFVQNMVKYISERNKEIMFISNSEMKCIVANSATSPSIQTYFSRLLHSIS